MPTGIYKRTKERHWKLTEDTKKKIGKANSISLLGNIPWNKNKKGYHIHNDNFKKNMSERLRGHMFWGGKETLFEKGTKHWNWRGGLTPLQKQEKLAGRKKPEQCEICGAMGQICYDHNHETGQFRGWICTRCNLVLGSVKDNVELLFSMIKYIKK